MSGRAPEGWYADPQAATDGPPGAERWWNGVRWTAHTRVASPPRDEPSAPAISSPGIATLTAAFAGSPHHTADGERLGGVPARIGAWVVDLVAVSVLGNVLGWAVYVVGSLLLGLVEPPASVRDVVVELGYVTGLAVLVVWFAYQVWFLRSSGATPGKQLFRLVVRPVDGPGRLGRDQALARAAVGGAHLLSPVAGFGGLLRLFVLVDGGFGVQHPQRQTLHDRAAGTVVVVRERPSSAPPRAWPHP